MTMKKMIKEQKGFTLIELMIVVAIIGILAAIAIPKFAQMLEKSREGTTKGNAGAIRSALAIYYGDREGVWPTTLDPSTAATWDNHLMSIYLDVLPQVKVTHNGVNTPATNPAGTAITNLQADDIPAVLGQGWAYDSFYGRVYVNSTYTDTKSSSYTTY